MKHLLFNKALRILLITNGLILLSGAMFGPIYALFVEEIGGDLLSAGLTGGIFALAAGLTTLVAGRYADKFKRDEYIVAGGYALLGIGFLLYTAVHSLLFLFAVQILIGFAEAMYSPAFDALYSRHITKKKAGREWGAWESMNYFSAALGAALGGVVASFLGFSALFVMMASLCFISVFIILRVPKRVF